MNFDFENIEISDRAESPAILSPTLKAEILGGTGHMHPLTLATTRHGTASSVIVTNASRRIL
jgi:hypothetical protein